MFKRRGKGNSISIARRFPDPAPKPVRLRMNPARTVLSCKAFLGGATSRGYSKAAAHFGVSRARISQLMTIANKVPEEVIVRIARFTHPEQLRHVSMRKLLRAAMESVPERRNEMAFALLGEDPQSCHEKLQTSAI